MKLEGKDRHMKLNVLLRYAQKKSDANTGHMQEVCTRPSLTFVMLQMPNVVLIHVEPISINTLIWDVET